MRLFKGFYLLFLIVSYFDLSQASAGPTSEVDLSTILEENKSINKLVVGCGKKPFNWKEDDKTTPGEQEYINAWRNLEGGHEEGKHSHSDAITLAEDASINPMIVSDWTTAISPLLKARFKAVYLEMLPPRVLAHENCFKNAFATLQPGGLFQADFQTSCSINSTFALADNLINPFWYVYRGKEELSAIRKRGEELNEKVNTLKEDLKRKKHALIMESGEKYFGKSQEELIAGIMKDPEFSAMLYGTKELELEVNQNACKMEERAKVYASQSKNEISDNLKDQAETELRKQLEAIGFTAINFVDLSKNSWNGRTNIRSIFAQKPKGQS